jgi:signal transduction histidine kinase
MQSNNDTINALLKEIYSLLNKKDGTQKSAKPSSTLELNPNFIKLQQLLNKKYFWKKEVESNIDLGNEILLKYAMHNYSIQLEISDDIDDVFNSLFTSINNLGEELNHSTVTKGYLEDIFNSIEDIIIVTDNMGYVNFINTATSRTLKYEDDEILRENIHILLDRDIPFNRLIDNKLNKENINLLTKFNERIPVNLRVSHFARGDNQDIGFVIIANDESKQLKYQQEIEKANEELKKALAKAEESDKLKTAFLQNMSHEIRTPLNGIVGFSQLLTRKDFPDDKKTEIARVVERSSYRLIELVNNILDLSKIETGQVKITNSAFVLNNLIREVYDFFELFSKEKNIKVTYNVGLVDNASIIYSDKEKIHQIFVNLINNSIKFTEKGEINFGYMIKNDNIEFFVKDTGIGIPEEFHKEIFNRFTQADNTITRNYEGAGLGLSISKGLVELFGGKIWVESEVNKSTHFFFSIPYFPVNGIASNESPSNINIENLSKTLKILVAEDDDINYMFLEYLFNSSKHKLVRAINGQEAIDICTDHKDFDIILMDLKMPVMSGFEATRIIKKGFSGVPVIALTAYVFEDDRQKAMSSGCDDFIVKPYRMEDLFEKIIRLVT